MAEVEQNLVIGGPETWQRWDKSVAIFRYVPASSFFKKLVPM